MTIIQAGLIALLVTPILGFRLIGSTRTSHGLFRLQAVSKDTLQECQKDLFALMDKSNCNPIMIRLAWHDAGTYDKNVGVSKFPKCGGANGSIRFDPELSHGANAGLTIAFNLLKNIKKKYDSVSWADILQMASAVAVEHAGGPKIPMRYGRIDAASPEDCAPEGNLPGAAAPFHDGSHTPGDHLRKVFYRMGFADKEIVALSGAHTLGRAWKNRSGFGAENGTKFTTGDVTPRADGKPGYGTKGGSSWTEKWLKFDNSYFTTLFEKVPEAELLYAMKYANDQAWFFADYAMAHKKLSELGSKFDPPDGLVI
eukprot:gene10331-21559_t